MRVSYLSTIWLISCIVFIFSSEHTYAQNAPTAVFATPVVETSLTDEIQALGTLQSNENVNLTTSVTERIIAINFTDNQRVAKGDLLIEMDASEEEAELAEEESRRKEAQRQVNRIRPLVDRGAASRAALDQQERDLNTAIARIKAIQARINERHIKAPFDGVVGIRNISVGALAQPGMIITTIDDDSQMKLDFSVPEVFLSTLKVGLTLKATASAYPNRTFNATITSVDSRIDPISRAVMARAILNNDDGLLKAGMLMQLTLQNNPRRALVIPEEALIISGSQNAVMRVIEDADGKTVAERVNVEIGTRNDGNAEIVSGLNAGDLIIHHGTLKVRPGAEVNVKAVEKNNETLTDLLQQSKDAQNN